MRMANPNCEFAKILVERDQNSACIARCRKDFVVPGTARPVFDALNIVARGSEICGERSWHAGVD